MSPSASSPPPGSVLRWGRRAAACGRWLAFGAAAAAVLCWVVGLVASDRLAATQFLHWIPAPLLAPIVAAGGLVAVRAPRWRPLAASCVAISIAIAATHLALRWSPRGPCAEGLRIVHWNASSPSLEEADADRRAIAELRPDLLLVTDDWALFGRVRGNRWEETGWRVHRAGPFAISTRLPLVEVRLAVASADRYLAVVRVDASKEIGRELVIWLVDLPSDPKGPRMAEARSLRSLIDSLRLPPPDLVAGDFNLDSGSAALRAIVPGLRDAFRAVGRGYAGSYPRRLPLWHLDQILLSPDLAACSYRVIDLGRGRHRAQELMLPLADPR
jgi:endonuclease/exonuclease/phosphatase (EEP) superfamily protein YafD